MAHYAQYQIVVHVEASPDRKKQLEEVVGRFLHELTGHEFHASGGRVEESSVTLDSYSDGLKIPPEVKEPKATKATRTRTKAASGRRTS